MVSYSSTKTVASKAHEGVTLTIRVMSEAFRSNLMLELMSVMAEIRQLQLEMKTYEDALPRNEKEEVDYVKAMNTEAMACLQGLTDKILVIHKVRVHPIYAREGFVRVNGLSLDGDDNPSIDKIRLSGSEMLYNEIVEAIKAEVDLTDAQRTNFGSPTSSGALDQEAKNSMTAPSVEITDSTNSETADASTLTT